MFGVEHNALVFYYTLSNCFCFVSSCGVAWMQAGISLRHHRCQWELLSLNAHTHFLGGKKLNRTSFEVFSYSLFCLFAFSLLPIFPSLVKLCIVTHELRLTVRHGTSEGCRCMNPSGPNLDTNPSRIHHVILSHSSFAARQFVLVQTVMLENFT